MLNFFRKNKVLIFWGILIEVIYLSVIILENIFPALLEKKILLYSFFIISSLSFLILLTKKIKISESKTTLKIIILFSIIFNLTLLFSFPLGPGDIYNYLFRAEVFTVYHQNPFLIAPVNFPQNPLSKYISDLAKSTPTIYGPLWMIISFLPALLSFNNIFVGVMIFKLLAIMFFFLCFWIIYKIISLLDFDKKNKYFLLFLWNPLLLFEIANEGHNDIIMVFFILLALYYLIREKFYSVIPLLTLSVMIKYISIIIIPFFLIFILKQKNKSNKFFINIIKNWKFIIINLIISLIIIITLFAPFLNSNQIFQGILHQAGMISKSHLSFFPFIISQISNEVLVVKIISYFAFFLFYLFILFHNQPQNIKQLINKILLAFILYLFVASFWLQAWYFIWIIPLLIITGKKYYNFAIIISVFAIIHQGYNLNLLISDFIKSF